MSLIEEEVESDGDDDGQGHEEDDDGLSDLLRLARQLINDHSMLYKSRDEYLAQKRDLLDRMIKRRLRRKRKAGTDDDDELLELLMQAR